jgi:hypothetical protein
MSLIEHIKGGATNKVQNATNQVERRLRSLRQEAKAQGERSAEATSVFTEKQPLVALIIAVGTWALACFGGESTQRPTVKIVFVSPAPRVASRHHWHFARIAILPRSLFCAR